MTEQVLESRLRPAVELYSVAVSAGAALLCLQAPWAVALTPQLGHWSAAGFVLFSLLRLRQAGLVLRYRRHIRRLPRYALTSRQIPLSRQRLFMGRGFRWTQQHTQRLVEAQEPAVRSEEHTSELQSREKLVCRLLLEKKNTPHSL